MKFEANIPSYLRTGQGVFPVKGKVASKVEKETNFFKLMEKGVNMPVSNELNGTESAPLGSPGMNEPLDAENFLEKMQKKAPEFKPRMEIDPKIDIKPDARPVMPMIAPQRMQEPKQLEAQADDADIFIG
jgi:hypothetical protein